MKKAIALAVCMVLIPFTAFSLEMVTDEEMDNITGQSGVAITVDDVVIHESGIEETWYQNNILGENNGGNNAAIGMIDPDNRESMMYVNALTGLPSGNDDFESPGQHQAMGTYDALFGVVDYSEQQFAYDPTESFSPSPLTIQVANVAEYDTFMNTKHGTDITWSAFSAAGYEGTEAVIIGLPTVEIYNEGTDAMQILMSTSDNPIGDTRGDGGASFGTLYTGGGSSMAILDGRIEIAPVEGVQAP